MLITRRSLCRALCKIKANTRLSPEQLIAEVSWHPQACHLTVKCYGIVKNFRALDLAEVFYRQVTELKLPTHLRDQLLRASSSVVLNLAEGRGKPSLRDQLRFFHIAMGSPRESQGILRLASDIDPGLDQLADRLGASLYLLIMHAR